MALSFSLLQLCCCFLSFACEYVISCTRVRRESKAAACKHRYIGTHERTDLRLSAFPSIGHTHESHRESRLIKMSFHDVILRLQQIKSLLIMMLCYDVCLIGFRCITRYTLIHDPGGIYPAPFDRLVHSNSTLCIKAIEKLCLVWGKMSLLTDHCLSFVVCAHLAQKFPLRNVSFELRLRGSKFTLSTSAQEQLYCPISCLGTKFTMNFCVFGISAFFDKVTLDEKTLAHRFHCEAHKVLLWRSVARKPPQNISP